MIYLGWACLLLAALPYGVLALVILWIVFGGDDGKGRRS